MKNLRSVLLCYRKLLIPVLAVFAAAALPAPIEARMPRFPDTSVTRANSPSGHPYMNGGISFDEQRAMERMATPYNLKLVFARRAGTLIAPTFLVIGANNGRHLEKILVRGPWFYIQLPPGAYTILARFDNQVVVIKDIYLGEDSRRTYLVRGD
jgi:hypothetical protein